MPMMTRLAKSVLETAIAKLDATVIANWRLSKYSQEQYMRKLIENFEIDLIFDVGANAGQYASFLRSAVGFTGMIVSYEPDPRSAERAERAFGHDTKWSMNRCALGARAGVARFNIMVGSELSSFLQPSTAALKRYGEINVVERTIDVEVRTIEGELARLSASHGCRRPYLKLDTQGFDLEVLAGAGAALSQFVGVQSEMSVMPIYEGMPDLVQSLAWLRDRGFELSAVFPVNSAHFPLLIEVDGHFVRNDLLDEARRQTALPRPT